MQKIRYRAQAKKAKDDCKININQLTCIRSLRLKMKGSRKVAMTDANKRRNGEKYNNNDSLAYSFNTVVRTSSRDWGDVLMNFLRVRPR